MKRIYATDGTAKSAPIIVMYPLLLLALPFMIAWCFICGAGTGIRYGYLDSRVEIESFKRLWRSAR